MLKNLLKPVSSAIFIKYHFLLKTILKLHVIFGVQLSNYSVCINSATRF